VRSESPKRGWTRIAGESAAIVLGILLAFAIDAGWDARKDLLEEREILDALEQDFQENHAAAERVIRIHRDDNARFAYLTSLSPGQVGRLPEDSIHAIISGLSAPFTSDPVRGTIDALLGAGKLDLIRSRELRDALIIFLNLVDDPREDAEYMGRAAERVWGFETGHGGPWQSRDLSAGGPALAPFLALATAETLTEIRADRPMMDAVRLFQATSFTYADEVRRIARQIDSVLVLLETR